MTVSPQPTPSLLSLRPRSISSAHRTTQPHPPPTQSPTTSSTTAPQRPASRLNTPPLKSCRSGELEHDDFFEESFKQWMLRDPESITAYGLAKIYGTGTIS